MQFRLCRVTLGRTAAGLLYVAAIALAAPSIAQVLTARPSPATFDPFNPTIQTNALAPTTAAADLTATATLDSASGGNQTTLARPPVRDPYRPPIRSGFRP